MRYIRITNENIGLRAHLLRHVGQAERRERRRGSRSGSRRGWFFTAARNGASASSNTFRQRTPGSPIDAPGYLYINCLWVAGSMKGHGYSSDLLGECIRDAKAQGRQGICILSAEGRKREFLSDPKYLAYKGFTVADTSGLRDHPHVSAADAVGGEANVQGMRQASGNQGGRLRSLLYGSVSVHLLLGAPGGGGRRGSTAFS